MDQMTERAKLPDLPAKVPESWRVKEAVDRYLAERGVGHYCNVIVQQNNGWYELQGTVDSAWTRAVLFSLIPQESGKRRILDRLVVVDEPLERSYQS